MIVENKNVISSGLSDYLSDVTKKNVEQRYRALSYYEGMRGEMESDLSRYFPMNSLEIPMI